MTKVCTKCKYEKNLSCFGKRGNSLKYYCKDCANKQSKIYYANNKEKILENNHKYRLGHKEEMLSYYKQYNLEHKGERSSYNKEYRLKNSEAIKTRRDSNKINKALWAKQYNIVSRNKIAKYRKKYRKERYRNDPHFRLNQLVSTAIRETLQLFGSSKNGESKSKYLSYSIKELKEHLEAQFEPWMSWENHGICNVKTWDDDDPNTWVWNIDHIIPKADLPHTSMMDDNFKKCWALENLRPFSAKQNILDGASRIRHLQKKD